MASEASFTLADTPRAALICPQNLFSTETPKPRMRSTPIFTCAHVLTLPVCAAKNRMAVVVLWLVSQ